MSAQDSDAATVAPPAARETASQAAPSADQPPAVIDVAVRPRARDSTRQLANSSAAVLVVDTQASQRESGDLGAVLARQQGINVQRAGGLGAQTRFSLQGLGEDQLRFYVDGVPLSFTGLPESIAYVPVDLVARAEVYRGVVPIRFGGDTLGGAVHLLGHTPEVGAHGSASLTLGAFDTQRAALRSQYLDEKSGLYASVSGFFDHARNDYPMNDVAVTQANGRREPRRVYRFNDAYRGGHGQLELGVVDRPYAKRLIVRSYLAGFDKQINNDLLMYNPYGEVLSRRRAQGATLFYDHTPRPGLTIEAKLGYARRERQLRDLGRCAYDWYGNCVSELANGGEIGGLPTNRKTADHNVFARVQLGLRASRLLQLRVSAAPTYTESRSHDAAVGEGIPDLFAQTRQLFGLVMGLEHELDAFASRLENVLFVKDYVQWLSADATAVQGMVSARRTDHRVGAGNAVRLRLHETLVGKLSYELGARLPDGNEVFGDGAFVEPNLGLRPESSHNANAELRWSYTSQRLGSASLMATGFFRQVDNFIFLLPGPTFAQYQNITTARIKGVEGSGRYTSPGNYLTVEGSATWQDMRNLATHGPFAMFEGERVPNRPYLFANVGITGRWSRVASADDALSATFRESYVGEFYRAFEVDGARDRGAVPTQLVSSLVFTYEVELDRRALSASLTLENLTDAEVYDFFGVQRPGRFAMAKLMYRM